MGLVISCCTCFTLIAVLFSVFSLLLIPTVNDTVSSYSQDKHAEGILMSMTQLMQFSAAVTTCMPDMLYGGKDFLGSCVRGNMAVRWFAGAHGWDGAGAGIKSFPQFGPKGLFFFAHHGVVKNANDPDVKRGVDYFIATKLNIIEDLGLIPKEGLFPVVINMATGDPERIKRRKFMNDFFPAFKPVPPSPLSLSGITFAKATDSKNISAAHAVVGYSIFKMMFDVELEAWELASMEEWGETMKPCAVGGCVCLPSTCKRVRSFYDHMVKRLSESTVGKRYLDEARDRGWQDPFDRLREILFISLFAGYGGTGDTTWGALSMLNKDAPKMLPLFRKDPEAFVLEAARIYPGVAGMNAIASHTQNLTLGNGRTYLLQEGDWFSNWNAGANLDAGIFGGPSKSASFAWEFRPGRDNADRLHTWNGELREMRKCGHTMGYPECKQAGRPCPGTFAAIHIIKTAISWFADGMEATKAEL